MVTIVGAGAKTLRTLVVFIGYYLEGRADLRANIVSVQGQGQFMLDDATTTDNGNADTINRLLNQFSEDLAETVTEFRIASAGVHAGITAFTADGKSRMIEPVEDERQAYEEIVASLSQEGTDVDAFISLKPLPTVLQGGLQYAISTGDVATFVKANSHALRYMNTLSLYDVSNETLSMIAQACPALTQLMVASNDTSLPALGQLPFLVTLQLKASHLQDLDGLENHPSLKSLTVYGGRGLTDAHVASLTDLQTLALHGTQDFNFATLANHPSIEVLELNGVSTLKSEGTPLSIIKTLPKLKELSIRGDNNLRSLKDLEGHPTLARIALEDMAAFNSLKWVENLPELTSVSVVGSSRIRDVEFVELNAVKKLSSFTMRTPHGPDGDSDVERDATRAMVDLMKDTLQTKFPEATIVWEWNYTGRAIA